MELKYLNEFTKAHVEDMEAVQKVVKLAGTIIDIKLFPLFKTFSSNMLPTPDRKAASFDTE